MRPRSVGLSLLLLVIGAAIVWRIQVPARRHHVHAAPVAGLETSPVCPWREPLRDLRSLFPPATNYVLTPLIVSRLTVEIEKKLGRHMTADENPLRVHRVEHGGKTLGSVLVTRVKGEHGSIEIVIGVETNGRVRGVLIQSQREPDLVASALTNLVRGFVDKTVAASFQLGDDLPDVPAEARVSAQAVATGVRDQLVVLSFAELPEDVRQTGRAIPP